MSYRMLIIFSIDWENILLNMTMNSYAQFIIYGFECIVTNNQFFSDICLKTYLKKVLFLDLISDVNDW